MIYRPNLSSATTILDSFVGWGEAKGYGGHPNLSDVDVRTDEPSPYARVTNRPEYRSERWFSWRGVAYKYGFAEAEAMRCVYWYRIDPAIATAGGFRGAGKLPGFSGIEFPPAGGFPGAPEPRASYTATWECRLAKHAYDPARGGWALAVYGYLTLNPTVWANQPDGAGVPIPGRLIQRPGVTSAPCVSYGQGNPQAGGWDAVAQRPTGLTTRGLLLPGRWHKIEQIVVLNTLKDDSLVCGGGQAGLDRAIANGNKDGYLGVKLDDELVGEWKDVVYRGERTCRFFEWWGNQYDGGTGQFISAPAYYDIRDIEVTDQLEQQQPEGAGMKVYYDPTKENVELIAGAPPEVAALQAQLNAANAKLDRLKANAEARMAADAATIDGKADLDIINGP